MGNTYVTFTTKGLSESQAEKALAHQAVTVIASNDALVIFEETCSEPDEVNIEQVGKHLSILLASPVLAVLNHDDDLIRFWLFDHGKCTDTYDSAPGWPDALPDEVTPTGGDAANLCAVFGKGTPAAVEKILRAPFAAKKKDGYVFAVDRHEALVKALGLPAVFYADEPMPIPKLPARPKSPKRAKPRVRKKPLSEPERRELFEQFLKGGQTARTLYDAGENPDMVHPDTGVTPLYEACARNRIKVMRDLLALGADPRFAVTRLSKYIPRYQANPLHPVRSSAAVNILVDAGANPNRNDGAGYTPLMLAAQDERVSLDTLRALVQRGANPLAETYGARPGDRLSARQLVDRQIAQLKDKLYGATQKRTANIQKLLENYEAKRVFLEEAELDWKLLLRKR